MGRDWRHIGLHPPESAATCRQSATERRSMKRGRKRHDGLDDLLPGLHFIRESIRGLSRSGYDPRDLDFIKRFREGETLHEIGVSYGLTRERVRQRLAEFGIKKTDGGSCIRRFKKTDEISARLRIAREGSDKWLRGQFAIPEEYAELILKQYGDKPFRSFKMQKPSRCKSIAATAARSNSPFPSATGGHFG